MRIVFILCVLFSILSCYSGDFGQVETLTKFEVVLREPLYSQLSEKVAKYKMSLSDKEIKFQKAAYQFNIPFFKVSAAFDSENGDVQDSIYASLGYDFDTIKILEMLFGKLLLEDPPAENEDTAVAIYLLALLRDATDSVKVILNEYLNKAFFVRLGRSKKGINIVSKIELLLDNMMRMRKDVILKIMKAMKKIQSEINNDPDILSRLSDIFDENRDIKRSVNLISNISKQIEILSSQFA
ncbi:hypothetical protein [Borrelia duttonii]|uniref:Lipoprotein n=1 Tax=Borrelia duttonii (strain Ly) TaxID=412419 RepID=B5RND2_BORDL|nr:putative lipoprotein [Borrelia duttonii Ly]